jgi:predicted dinucleotide-binding enzyme
VAADIGGRAAGTNAEAVAGADMIVLAVPSTAIAGILDEVVDDTMTWPPRRQWQNCSL